MLWCGGDEEEFVEGCGGDGIDLVGSHTLDLPGLRGALDLDRSWSPFTCPAHRRRHLRFGVCERQHSWLGRIRRAIDGADWRKGQ
jgi:hypothetical protein